MSGASLGVLFLGRVPRLNNIVWKGASLVLAPLPVHVNQTGEKMPSNDNSLATMECLVVFKTPRKTS